jgi:hypothetical protein
MQHYNKFIVAIAGAAVGLVVGLAQQHLGLDLSANAEVLKNLIIAGLTAAGVYAVSNEEA